MNFSRQARYTLLRIVANVCVVPVDSYVAQVSHVDAEGNVLRMTDELRFISVFESLSGYVDAVARPVITGLGVYCFLRKNSRFSQKLRLHVWSRRTIFCLAFCVADQTFGVTYGIAKRQSGTHFDTLVLASQSGWLFLCNIFQVYMSKLKLSVLGWHLTAKICQMLLLINILCITINWGSFFGGFNHLWITRCMMLSFLATLLLQSIALCWAATKALLQGGNDETIRCTAYCLYVNGVLAILGPLLSVLSAGAIHPRNRELTGITDEIPVIVVTLDVGLQVLTTLLLSGMIGPKGWERPMEAFRKLAHLSGFGLASKRIAFPGKINAHATECIVSFPGKYSIECLGFA